MVYILLAENHTLGIQSYSQMMIKVPNHLLSIVFSFHYHSQKVIGSLGIDNKSTIHAGTVNIPTFFTGQYLNCEPTCWLPWAAVATLPIEAFTIREAFTRLFYTLRIHGTGIFTYIYHKNQPKVGKYTSPMDP